MLIVVLARHVESDLISSIRIRFIAKHKENLRRIYVRA